MAEFQIIKDYFDFEQEHSRSIKKAIGDDCAVLDIPQGKQLVVSTDTLVSGVHFFSNVSPADLAYKALVVNVSDLLAMGAEPLAFTLAITLPETSPDWLKAFAQSLKQAAEQFSIKLIGGDTTQGPLSINISVYGLTDAGKAVLRNGAQLDDDVWVTGTLGSARSALSLHNKDTLDENEQQLWQRLVRPVIPYKFASELSKFAHSAIDISDGLLADLGHIIKQSQLGAQIAVEALPLDEALITVVGLEQARQSALSGGDDYQLCFTADSQQRQKIIEQAEQCQIQVTRIGKITGQGLEVLLEQEAYLVTENSWQHFAQGASNVAE